jgi:hypothetical protein
MLLCHRHHWLIHEGDWQLAKVERGRLLAIPPSGTHRSWIRHWLIHEGDWQLAKVERGSLLAIPPSGTHRSWIRAPDVADDG